MSLGERLTKLRKERGLSQEEVADKLNVTRQTVSKWETDQSTPDFDKIVPICNLYNIKSEELLTGKVVEKETYDQLEDEKKEKRVGGLVVSIFLYFIAVVWIMISVAALKFNPVVSAGIFIGIIGLATCILIYTSLMYKKKKIEKNDRKSKILKQIDEVLSTITVIIYLIISFVTMAWHITWIIFIIYGLISEIVKLIFVLKGDDYEE